MKAVFRDMASTGITSGVGRLGAGAYKLQSNKASNSNVECNIPRRSFLRLTASALAAGFSGAALAAPIVGRSQASAATFLDSVGINVHFSHRDTPYFFDFDKVVSLLKDIGITHLRDDAVYASYVNRDYEYYRRVRFVAGAGFRFALVCQDALNGYIFTPPRELPDIYDWCDQSIDIFEGANEPNLTRNPRINPAISADHQRSIYATVKATPSLKDIIVASPSYIQKSIPLAENLSDAVDWINLHPYPGREHPETNGPGALDGFVVSAERIFGKKPMLISETGYHTAVETKGPWLPVSESIKTRYLPRLLLWNFINGIKRTYIYELIDSVNNGLADSESNLGLVDYNGNPKSSFSAVKQLLTLFRAPSAQNVAGPDLEFELNGDYGDLLTAAFKRDDGSHLFFSWLGVSGWERNARVAQPPVERKYIIAINPIPRSIVAHQFQDDGSVVKTQLDRTPDGFPLTIRDQLTALEITA
jgi:hypothetical protein